MLWTVFKDIVGIGSTVLGSWQKRKQARLNSQILIQEAVTTAKVKRLNEKQGADIAWENTSIDHAGWKDEFWTVVLAIPCVLCFFPGMVDHVVAGFDALDKCPAWYRWCLLVAIGSSFGYRKLADFMKLKKGD